MELWLTSRCSNHTSNIFGSDDRAVNYSLLILHKHDVIRIILPCFFFRFFQCIHAEKRTGHLALNPKIWEPTEKVNSVMSITFRHYPLQKSLVRQFPMSFVSTQPVPTGWCTEQNVSSNATPAIHWLVPRQPCAKERWKRTRLATGTGVKTWRHHSVKVHKLAVCIELIIRRFLHRLINVM